MSEKYDIIEQKTVRESRGVYRNEIIALDLDTYKRVKIEFLTKNSGFIIEISNDRDGIYDFSDFACATSNGRKVTMMNHRQFIPNDKGVLINISDID